MNGKYAQPGGYGQTLREAERSRERAAAGDLPPDGTHAGAGDYSIQLGDGASASDFEAVAIGRNATAGGPGSSSQVAVGEDATATGPSTVAVGSNATATGDGAAAFGRSTTASGVSALAAGREATATQDRSVAVGYGTSAGHVYSTALGAFAATTADHQLMVSANEVEVMPYDVGIDPSSIVLYSPDGTRWRLSVSDAGVLGVAAA